MSMGSDQSTAFVNSRQKKEAVRRLTEEGRLETVYQPIWRFDAEKLLEIAFSCSEMYGRIPMTASKMPVTRER